MESIIQYRIFYWVPNTLSGERVAIGLCLFDQEMDRLDTHWVAQRELTRLQNIFQGSSKSDAKDVLSMLNEVEESWKSKAFNSSFWNYIERYWNGILQVSESRKLYYDGSAADFGRKSAMLKQQLLPLADLDPKDVRRRPAVIRQRLEKLVKQKKLVGKVSLGPEIPKHGKYRLLKSIYLDLGARAGHLIGSAGFDFSLKEETLINHAHSYFDAFNNIRRIDGGGTFGFILHHRGKPYLSTESVKEFYDDFRYRCKDLKIDTLHLDEIEDYIDELSAKQGLKPLEEEEVV